MGFANAPGVPSNVALRDVRLALEWIRSNIGAFGGDVDRITMFGQSQGAYLISYYAYAYPNDPIASSFIQQSGSAFSNVTQTLAETASVWKQQAAIAGCNNTSNAATLDCMRAQSLSTILDAWASSNSLDPLRTPQNGPVIDGELIFANYSEKTLAGEFARKVSRRGPHHLFLS